MCYCSEKEICPSVNTKKCWQDYEQGIPYASVVEVFQTGEEFILFDDKFLAEKFGKVTWLNLKREALAHIN